MSLVSYSDKIYNVISVAHYNMFSLPYNSLFVIYLWRYFILTKCITDSYMCTRMPSLVVHRVEKGKSINQMSDDPLKKSNWRITTWWAVTLWHVSKHLLYAFCQPVLMGVCVNFVCLSNEQFEGDAHIVLRQIIFTTDYQSAIPKQSITKICICYQLSTSWR